MQYIVTTFINASQCCDLGAATVEWPSINLPVLQGTWNEVITLIITFVHTSNISHSSFPFLYYMKKFGRSVLLTKALETVEREWTTLNAMKAHLIITA